MFYEKSLLMEEKDPVIAIGEAIAKTLVNYYPFAGRLIEGPNDKLMVVCNSEGAMFIEADSDNSLRQLGEAIFPPSPFSKELLNCEFASNEMVGCPLMLIQITRFICGGFSMGVRVNHVICDAPGLVQFLQAMADIAKGASSPCIQPVWQRELLIARNPPRITCVHHEYHHHNDPNTMEFDDNLSNRSFFFGPQEISSLRKHLGPHLKNSSKFDVITACIWRSRTRALKIPSYEDVRISFMVNVRGKKYLQLPSGYYGNAVVAPAAVTKANELCENPLEFALQLLMKARAQVNEEYIRSVTDLMAIKGRPPFSSSWNFLVSDLSRLEFDEIDFGWGKATYGGTLDGGTMMAIKPSIYARCRRSNGCDYGILVTMCLPKPAMERFEEELTKLIHQNTNDFKKSKTKNIISTL